MVAGSRTPVEVSEAADYHELKRVAFEKLNRYVVEIKTNYEIEDLELVYKSGEVAHYIPGTHQLFTLKTFKEDLAAKYSEILLYLKPVSYSDDEDPPPAFRYER